MHQRIHHQLERAIGQRHRQQAPEHDGEAVGQAAIGARALGQQMLQYKQGHSGAGEQAAIVFQRVHRLGLAATDYIQQPGIESQLAQQVGNGQRQNEQRGFEGQAGALRCIGVAHVLVPTPDE